MRRKNQLTTVLCYWFGFSTLHIHHAASIPVLKSTTLTASYQLAPLWRPRVFIVTLEPAKVTLNCCAQTYTRTSTMCLSALFICFSLARSLRPPLPLSHLSLPPSCGEADKELIYRPIKCRHWNIASNKPDVFTRANWPSTNMFTCWICVSFWVLCVRLVFLCTPCSV